MMEGSLGCRPVREDSAARGVDETQLILLPSTPETQDLRGRIVSKSCDRCSQRHHRFPQRTASGRKKGMEREGEKEDSRIEDGMG